MREKAERDRRRPGTLREGFHLSPTGVSPNPTNPSETAGLGWRKPLPEAQLPVGERPLFPAQVIFAKCFVSTVGRKSPPEVI